MKIKSKTISAISFSMLMVASASAEMYLGTTFGVSNPEESGFDDDSAFKFTGGYQFSEILAMEIAWVDLGEFDLKYPMSIDGYSATGSIEIDGFEISVLGSVPVNESFSLFGRASILSWDADINVNVSGFSGSESDDGSDFAAGVGGIFSITESVSVTVEFTRYDAMDGDVDLMGVGVNFSI